MADDYPELVDAFTKLANDIWKWLFHSKWCTQSSGWKLDLDWSRSWKVLSFKLVSCKVLVFESFHLCKKYQNSVGNNQSQLEMLKTFHWNFWIFPTKLSYYTHRYAISWIKTIVIQCQSQWLNQDFFQPIVSLFKFLLKFVQNKLTQKYSSLIKFCNAQIRDSIKFTKLNFFPIRLSRPI